MLEKTFDEDILIKKMPKKTEYKKIRYIIEKVFEDDPRSMQVIDEVFDNIYDAFKRQKANQQPIELTTNVLKETLVKTAGLRIGSMMGTKTIQVPALFGKVFDKLLTQLPQQRIADMIEEILINPDRFNRQINLLTRATDEVEIVAATKGLIDAFDPNLMRVMPVTAGVEAIKGAGGVLAAQPGRFGTATVKPTVPPAVQTLTEEE